MQVRFYTLGCKVNQYEAQALRDLFAAEGFAPVEEGTAQVYIVSSCAVTAVAGRKTRQTVRRLRSENPGAVIALIGCLPQAFPDEAGLAEADIVTGTYERARLPELVRGFLSDGKRRVKIMPHAAQAPFEVLTPPCFDGRYQRAYLKVEDGCDRFCAYCAVPLARGPVRSLPLNDVAREAAILGRQYAELVLTGVNLSRYGADLGLSLPDAVLAAAQSAPGARLRLGSIEPDLLSHDDYRRLAEMPSLCPHFHLAAQSGCDATLARMGRRYDAAWLLETAAYIRRRWDNPSITLDLIAGFPGETEMEFLETCRLVESLGILRAHVFPYSSRPGTAAASMSGQVSDCEKKRRAAHLSALCHREGERFAQSQVDKIVRILPEATGGGYADNYLYVTPQGVSVPGALMSVHLTGVDQTGCTGVIL
ncbi:MAG: MiaB/RimO family radical SAM methylthiotransferase [Oscillospiraceae bacterium]